MTSSKRSVAKCFAEDAYFPVVADVLMDRVFIGTDAPKHEDVPLESLLFIAVNAYCSFKKFYIREISWGELQDSILVIKTLYFYCSIRMDEKLKSQEEAIGISFWPSKTCIEGDGPVLKQTAANLRALVENRHVVCVDADKACLLTMGINPDETIALSPINCEIPNCPYHTAPPKDCTIKRVYQLAHTLISGIVNIPEIVELPTVEGMPVFPQF